MPDPWRGRPRTARGTGGGSNDRTTPPRHTLVSGSGSGQSGPLPTTGVGTSLFFQAPVPGDYGALAQSADPRRARTPLPNPDNPLTGEAGWRPEGGALGGVPSQEGSQTRSGVFPEGRDSGGGGCHVRPREEVWSTGKVEVGNRDVLEPWAEETPGATRGNPVLLPATVSDQGKCWTSQSVPVPWDS